MSILEELEKYFENTPREQVEKDWQETEENNKVGITVEEYLSDDVQEYIEWVRDNFHKGVSGETHWDGE